ncbi:MAG: EndoU domain-containing protein [Chitinophagales bacterium]|nr:EndoU domain-containing protein [Chitinophagales bacterium]
MEVDVLFIKGMHIETAVEEFFVIYKGEIIAKGTAKEVREILKKAMAAAGKSRIISALDKIFDSVHINDKALIHSNVGDFAGAGNPKKSLAPGKMLGGGHGQANIDKLEQLNREYQIVHEYKNGVRIGSISKIADKFKKTSSTKMIAGQSWFPPSWDELKIMQAGKFVISNNMKKFLSITEGIPIFDNFEGVRVGVMKTEGKPATIFPDNAMQPIPNSNNIEFNPIKK